MKKSIEAGTLAMAAIVTGKMVCGVNLCSGKT